MGVVNCLGGPKKTNKQTSLISCNICRNPRRKSPCGGLDQVVDREKLRECSCCHLRRSSLSLKLSLWQAWRTTWGWCWRWEVDAHDLYDHDQAHLLQVLLSKHCQRDQMRCWLLSMWIFFFWFKVFLTLDLLHFSIVFLTYLLVICWVDHFTSLYHFSVAVAYFHPCCLGCGCSALKKSVTSAIYGSPDKRSSSASWLT